MMHNPAFWWGVVNGAWVVLAILWPMQIHALRRLAAARREITAARSIAVAAIPLVLRIEPPPGVRVLAVDFAAPPPPKPDKPS